MKNVALYFRVSTADQDCLSQHAEMDRWLANLPKDKQPISVRRFQDDGWSGTDDSRPAFQSLLKAAKNKEIDTILVYKLDRFSRNASTAIRTILELDSYGVGFIAISQAALNLGHDNPFRRTFLAMFADLAEIERQTIVERVRAGLEAARRRGQKLGRPELPEYKREKIRRLLAAGFNKSTISHQLGISRMTINKVLKKA